jgi:hypothetical protein
MAASETAVLNRQLARVRRRLFAQTLLVTLAWAWSAALAVAAAWFLAQPWLWAEPPGWLRWAVAGGLAGCGTLLAVALAVLRRPSHIAAALALDERFGLKERVTTAVTLDVGAASSAAGVALLADVNNRIAPLRIADRFPIRLPRAATLVPALGLLLALLALFYRPVTAMRGKAGEEQPVAADPAARAEVERKLKQLQKRGDLQLAGRRPKSPELQRIEAELDKLSRKPHQTREQAREVVKDLTGAEEQVRKREKELADRGRAIQEQMKQLDRLTGKKPQDGPARPLEKALDKADFKTARDEAEKLGRQLEAEALADRLRKKVKEPGLTEGQKKEAREQFDRMQRQGTGLKPEQREQVQKQLQDIEDKLERLTRSEEAKERLRQMERDGLLNKEQLQRELDQMERNCCQLDAQTKKTLGQIAQKLREAGQAMRQGNNAEAAQKLKEAGELMAKLDGDGECKALAQQLKDLEAARQALCRALDGKAGPPGSGGPASGRRPESKDGATGSVEDWSHSQLDKGRLQVIDHVPGDGFKGPRKPAEMTDDIRRAAQEAPEAIDRQRLPKSASDMARGFFEKLRGTTEKKD